MSVSEASQRTEAAAATGGVAQPGRVDVAVVEEHEEPSFGHVAKLGFLFGTPVLYGVVAAVCMLAAPGNRWLLLIALWPALLGGWFFGGVAVLTVLELRAQRQRQGSRSGGRARPWRSRHAAAH